MISHAYTGGIIWQLISLSLSIKINNSLFYKCIQQNESAPKKEESARIKGTMEMKESAHALRKTLIWQPSVNLATARF